MTPLAALLRARPTIQATDLNPGNFVTVMVRVVTMLCSRNCAEPVVRALCAALLVLRNVVFSMVAAPFFAGCGMARVVAQAVRHPSLQVVHAGATLAWAMGAHHLALRAELRNEHALDVARNKLAHELSLSVSGGASNGQVQYMLVFA